MMETERGKLIPRANDDKEGNCDAKRTLWWFMKIKLRTLKLIDLFEVGTESEKTSRSSEI